jgi:hypothetical protein
VFKVEHNLTDPAEYPYDKQYENKLNKVQTHSHVIPFCAACCPF